MKYHIRAATLFAALSLAVIPLTHAAEVVVYKSPTCGCCNGWVDHLRANGFEVQTHDVSDVVTYKERHGVPARLGSCHTALVDGYVIEGHVPAADIMRLLSEQRPDVVGLAVPGMPSGSPGMSGPPQPYQVISFDRAGKEEVFASH